LNLERRGVLAHVLLAPRLWNRHHAFLPENPGECNLIRRRPVAHGHLFENALRAQASLLERRVRHHHHISRAAPRQESALDPAALQVVIDLIRDGVIPGGAALDFFEIGDVEVADPPMKDLAFVHQTLERLHGLAERVASPPMQKVKIDAVRAKPSQASFAGLVHAGA